MSVDPEAASADLPLTIGRYKLRARLASNSLGDVYHGFDPLIERPVVVRVFRLECCDPASHASIRQTFYEEMQRTGALMHHGIAALFDAGELPGGLFMASEFVEGASLAELLARGESFDLPTRASLLSQMADALEYSHQAGVWHLSLEPHHLLVGTDQMLKIGGFGVARIVDALAGAAAGVPAPAMSRYVSPERAHGEPGDARSDVFSLAHLALDVLRPADETHDELSEGVPLLPAYLAERGVSAEGWTGVFSRALAPRPIDRFPSAVMLMMEMLLMLGVGGAQARSIWERPPAAAGQGAPGSGGSHTATATTVSDDSGELDSTATTMLGGVVFGPQGNRLSGTVRPDETRPSPPTGTSDGEGQTMLAPSSELPTHTSADRGGSRTTRRIPPKD